MKRKLFFATLLILIATLNSFACTIFSAKDGKGNVWTGNNEDMYFTFDSFLNIYASTDSTFGYICLTHFSSKGYLQGGANEAGLFFDGNAVYPSVYRDYELKKDFPGGPVEMMHYVLKKCRTVDDVFRIFKKYRLEGLEAAQLHFADRLGNFGIIVADSMWITHADYQISTNYNLSHPGKDGINCWRYPIAESLLKNRERGLSTFTSICDSTSRKTRYSTVYSNIHNLTTGEVWFFYGMDYQNAFHTSIRALTEAGTRSVPLYEMFIQKPLVIAYKTCLVEGPEESLKELNIPGLSSSQKSEILRLLIQDRIHFYRDFECYPFIEEYFRTANKPDEYNIVLKAISLFCLGRQDEATGLLEKYLSGKPGSREAQEILSRISGIPVAGANVRLELNGYPDARYVFVDGISISPVYDFLVKQGTKWVGHFRLAPDEYHYSFLVEGMRILDPLNNDIVTDGGSQFNRIIIGQ